MTTLGRRKVTLRFRTLGLVPLAVVLALLFAPTASADGYTDQVVDKFNAQTHVVADPSATPPLQNPDRLNQQILSGPWSWSSSPPVWVAAVAPGQTGVTTADDIHNVILGRNPEFSGVILVIDSRGYHVRAYNVPQAIADSVDPLMRQSARDHRNDPYGATSEFINRLSGVNANAGGGATRTSPVVHQKHGGFAWLWTMLIIVGVVLAVTGLLWFAVNRNRKRRNDAWARDQVKQEMIAATAGVSDIDNAVMTNSDVDVSAESMKANSSLHDARKAYEAGDFGAARAHLKVVQSTVARANQKINPTANVSAVTSVPEADRKQASVQTRNPATGESVTINNNNYSTTPQPGYPHYYGGGYYNGMFFYPGYYPYSFWGPGWGWAITDVLLMDALLDDHWGGSYDRGFEGGYEAGRDSALADSNYDSGQSSGWDSPQGDVGFSGQDSGGGDVGFGGSGGGYDSGGGGFDFGGFGGSDSGGGSFDFGGGSDFGGGGFDSGGGGDSGF
jgi:hypothetical protein